MCGEGTWCVGDEETLDCAEDGCQVVRGEDALVADVAEADLHEVVVVCGDVRAGLQVRGGIFDPETRGGEADADTGPFWGRSEGGVGDEGEGESRA